LAPPTESGHGSEPVFPLLGVGLVVWMLDYDCVRDMKQDADGVAQAVNAFWRNDAYFPRPYAFGQTGEDRELWEAFKGGFLVCSIRVLERRGDGRGVWASGEMGGACSGWGGETTQERGERVRALTTR
jgi:hypothetical protein